MLKPVIRRLLFTLVLGLGFTSLAQQPLRFRASPDQVVVFEERFYAGLKQAFSEDVADLKGTLIGNDRIRSLRVPQGYQVTLYEHPDFRGRKEIFTADDADLSDNRIGLDRASALRIEKLSDVQ